MKSKVLKVILIYFTITIIYFRICPYLLGSQIDKEFLQSIDTEKLTEQCANARILVDYEDKNMKTAIFGKREGNVDVLVNIDIYNENIYDSKAEVYYSWFGIKKLLEFDTVISVRKNNIIITVFDHTKEIRSRNGEIFLKEVFAELGM